MPRPDNDRRFWRGRTVLVTGCSGFLGTWLTRALLDDDARVVGLLRSEPDERPFFRDGLARRIVAIRGTLGDTAVLERTLVDRGVEVVFHLAAQAIAAEAVRDPAGTLESNIAGTWSVMEACRRAGTVRAVILASSVKAYGSHPDQPFDEQVPLRGVLPYDASKIGAELAASMYHDAYGIPVVIARCGNLFGGGDLHWDRLVPATIRAGIEGRAPVIRSDGTPLRDYLFVVDAVDAFLRLARAVDDVTLRGQAFNVGTGLPLSELEMTERVLAAIGRSDLRPRVGDAATTAVVHHALLTDRLRQATGWSPAHTLDEGLALTVSWYRDYFAGTPPDSVPG